MGALGLPAFLYLVGVGMTIASFWRLLPRAGHSPWLSILCIVPVFALILLWFLAFTPWPGDEE